jgi:hypothetical protein
MAIPIVKADLEARIGAGEVARYSRGVDANVTAAIAEAWDSARSAGLNVFTPESWDALDSGTLPPEAKRHIVSDAIDLLSAGNNRTNGDFIEKKADEAKQWRAWLAGDTVRSFDAVLVRIETRDDDAGVEWRDRERLFPRGTNLLDPFSVRS